MKFIGTIVYILKTNRDLLMRLLLLTFATFATLVSAAAFSNEFTERFEYKPHSMNSCFGAIEKGKVIAQVQNDLGDNRIEQITWFSHENRVFKHIMYFNRADPFAADRQFCLIDKL